MTLSPPQPVPGPAMTEKYTHVYVGIKSCGCCVAGRVDTPESPKDVAKCVASMIMDGLRVERVSVDDARCTLRGCKCGEPPTGQLTLLPEALRAAAVGGGS